MLKLIRMSTVGSSLDIFCRGFLSELSHEYEVIALSSPDESLRALSRRENVKAIGVKMKRSISPLSDLVSLIKLIAVFRKERPDILHTMTPKAGLLGMIAGRLTGVPVRIHTFTGLLFPTSHGLKRRLLIFTDRLTCASATHIIPEGEGVKTDLITHRITNKPLKVLGFGNVRGVDVSFFQTSPELSAKALSIRERFGIPSEGIVFIFIGRFVGDKGLRELVKAFKLLGETDYHLLLVGDIEGSSDDIDISEIKKIRHIHISQGWVNDVRPWLAAADILVFPSYREGFPNVVLEAGAMELPSIVTDINGSREIIREGHNGLIVPPRNVEALTNAMRKLAKSPQATLKAMGKAARENVIAKYTQRFVMDCLKDYYRQIINDRTIN